MKINKIKQTLVILLLFNFVGVSSQSLITFFEESDAFFKQYVSNGKVDYNQIKTDPNQLNKLLELAKDVNVKKENSSQYRAFWINTYNLIVINSIVANYPVKSPLEISGFFDKKIHSVSGKSITLNDIENKVLRAQFNNDPRFHFVLVCAGLGCPPIINKAYQPITLEEQLNEQTILALNNDDFIKVNSKKKKVQFSQIFEWYTSDFTAQNESLIEFVNTYRKDQIPITFKTSYYTYDWTLNTTK
jgi:hypothetical protein